MTAREINHVKQVLCRNRRSRYYSWEKITRLAALDDRLVARTVQRTMERHGYKQYTAIYKPLLSDAMMAARKAWALKQLENSANKPWELVLWSDECAVKLGEARSKKRVIRLASEKWHPDCISRSFKKYSEFMWWGCIGWDYKGPGYVYRNASERDLKAEENAIEEISRKRMEEAAALTTMQAPESAVATAHTTGSRLPKLQRSQRYRGGIDWYVYASEILEPLVIPALREFRYFKNNREVLFMQDGAPSHTHHEILRRLKEFNIKGVDWPGNSPDLNPIEGIWRLMKSRIRKLEPPPLIRADLKAAWEAEWTRLTVEDINNEILRFTMRLHKVVAQDGGNHFDG